LHGGSERLDRTIEELTKLPTIGRKTAQRLALHLIKTPAEEVAALVDAILDMKKNVRYCSECGALTEADPCPICGDTRRDRHTICVVEEPLDVVAIEKTDAYRGLYHVLHGAISPVDGVGPDELRLKELVERLRHNPVREVILATNPSLEGEATAMYLERQIAPLGAHITRLARGLPVGGDLEYADTVTLTRALEGRRKV